MIAADEEQARNIHPDDRESILYGVEVEYSEWCLPEHVNVKLLGEAVAGSLPGVVCSSFDGEAHKK